jgi:chemotaxis signal transduction protein
VLELPGAQIARQDDILPEGSGGAPLLQGVAQTAEGTVLLLDLDHLFTSRQVRSLAAAVDALPDATSLESQETCLAEPELEAEV